MSIDNAKNLQTLRALLNAFNAHDINLIMQFFADDCALSMPTGAKCSGKQAVSEALGSRFTDFPDIGYTNDTHWATSEHGVSCWTLSGTRSNGHKIKVDGCDLITFNVDGLIINKNSFWKLEH